MDANMHENRGAFPVDRPVEALLRDHNMVRKLVETYRNSQSLEVKQEAAPQILMLLDMHSKLEETVFYPAVRKLDPSLIGHFEEEHHKADDLVQSLQSMTMDDPQAEQMFQQLIDMTMHHIQEEENDFFPKLEQANLDMTEIGLQMQAFEANLVHMQAKASDQSMRR
ncbi:Hemerythrin HHE cation binding domain-containing protein [Noviherbaspirillum humi]|uniref:Hemerythrin HHE cation binding domain-containing protein n=1 Tax=Noviherbaspirillum humi TaxID=1688639 RepID=A0A239G6V7_9BURK|nr:hemerythrin domain-containing protein [Noviherbaspirillum humi]SNS64811.1 Hemerythrin HHE cation binding domain-containing protein [Noviherbaspirillum humi]